MTFQSVGLQQQIPGGVVVPPAEPNRIYVGLPSGLVVSEDGGASWTPLGAPFAVTASALDPATGLLYAGTAGGGVYAYAP